MPRLGEHYYGNLGFEPQTTHTKYKEPKESSSPKTEHFEFLAPPQVILFSEYSSYSKVLLCIELSIVPFRCARPAGTTQGERI